MCACADGPAREDEGLSEGTFVEDPAFDDSDWPVLSESNRPSKNSTNEISDTTSSQDNAYHERLPGTNPSLLGSAQPSSGQFQQVGESRDGQGLRAIGLGMLVGDSWMHH